MQITTGYGYYVDSNNKKISKYVLSIGSHPDPVGLTAVEVANQAALDAITLDAKTPTTDEQKQAILDQLAAIDSKSIRAIRTNDTTRMAAWETQAATLRTQLAALGS